MRIKINQVQLKETKQENQITHERVAADRHYETQAAIVRIMKSRKDITHQELVVEVIKATKDRGALDPADIKLNIEKCVSQTPIICILLHLSLSGNQPLFAIFRLIEKDYLEREGGYRYKYLA
jgi:hypothetical protein